MTAVNIVGKKLPLSTYCQLWYFFQ